jgi:hypothetical protein
MRFGATARGTELIVRTALTARVGRRAPRSKASRALAQLAGDLSLVTFGALGVLSFIRVRGSDRIGERGIGVIDRARPLAERASELSAAVAAQASHHTAHVTVSTASGAHTSTLALTSVAFVPLAGIVSRVVAFEAVYVFIFVCIKGVLVLLGGFIGFLPRLFQRSPAS